MAGDSVAGPSPRRADGLLRAGFLASIGHLALTLCWESLWLLWSRSLEVRASACVVLQRRASARAGWARVVVPVRTHT